MTALAWVLAVGSFIALAVALQFKPSCASSVGIVCAGAFIASFFWLAYQYDRRDHR